jgi:VanZ family protein
VRRVSGFWLFAACAWGLVIVAFGVVPTEEMVSAAGPDREVEVTSFGHFAEYAVLAVFVAAALGGWGARPRSLLAGLAVAAGLGAVVEVVQAFLPYRDCQAADALVNALGAVCGLALMGAVALVRGRR